MSSATAGQFDFGSLKMIASIVSLSIIRFAYTRSLIPLYATVPTEYLLNQITTATVAVAALLPPDWRPNTTISLGIAALWITLSPIASHTLAVITARYKNPVAGPAIVHGSIFAPIVFALVSYGMEAMAHSPGALSTLPPLFARGAIVFVTHQCLTTFPALWEQIPFLTQSSDNNIILTVAGGAVICFIVSVARPPDERDVSVASAPTPRQAAKSKKNQPKKEPKSSGLFTTSDVKYGVLFGLWLTLAPKFCRSPVLSDISLSEPYYHPTAALRILSSVQSNTGLIVVGEALPSSTEMSSLRYLRASHSLLGGVWVGEKVATIDGTGKRVDSKGELIGDSIYSAFVLQEAARLTRPLNPEKPENVLIIGLGAGISATAFHRHNMSLTILEIDKAVYDAARTYFGLPDIGTDNVFLSDARGWVHRHRNNEDTSKKLYDVVIHDCFSGGGVPFHMFSMQFWEDLKTIMNPGGVVAVNFAGKPDSLSSRHILRTLENTFGECRAFHDMFNTLTEAQYQTEFVNIVFFCTNSNKPPSFRGFVPADALNSHLRQHVLKGIDRRELNLEILRETESAVLTDETSRLLGDWQDAEAMHHWTLMREVLDDVHWETY